MSKNTYMFDSEDLTEMIRLLGQGEMLTRAMGQLFPDSMNPVSSVLDLACGPGEWALELAYQYPNTNVTGIDISARMVEYAQVQALARKLPNTHFQQMTVLDRTKSTLIPYIEELPSESYDLINARFLSGFMPIEAWPALLEHCHRLLRPGGFLQMTEGDTIQVNANAYRRLIHLLAHAMYQAGTSFSDEYTAGVVLSLSGLIRKSGFQFLDHLAHVIDYSAGSPEHENLTEDTLKAFKGIPNFLEKYKLLPADLDELMKEIEGEFQSPNFCGIWYFSTLTGRKK